MIYKCTFLALNDSKLGSDTDKLWRLCWETLILWYDMDMSPNMRSRCVKKMFLLLSTICHTVSVCLSLWSDACYLELLLKGTATMRVPTCLCSYTLSFHISVLTLTLHPCLSIPALFSHLTEGLPVTSTAQILLIHHIYPCKNLFLLPLFKIRLMCQLLQGYYCWGAKINASNNNVMYIPAWHQFHIINSLLVS